MRSYLLFFLSLAVLLIGYSFAIPLHAQTSSMVDQCDKAKNNNAMLSCIKGRHEEGLEQLNTLYEEVQALQSQETLDDFRASQRDWIAYRDKECTWKANQTENEMLKRINELSCLTNLTSLRSSVLVAYLDNQQVGEAEALSSIPLWMNVLGDEHPDVFWKNAQRVHGDLDCDGADEQILTGVRIYQSEPVQQEVFIAIVENPITGQPKTTVFTYPVAKKLQDTYVCTPNVAVVITQIQNDVDGDDSNDSAEDDELIEQKTCSSVLKIESDDCAPIEIFWDGKKYTKISAAL